MTKEEAKHNWEKLKEVTAVGHPYPAIVEMDMNIMHAYYGVHDVVNTFDTDKLTELFEFRLNCIQEELNETRDAFANKNPQEIVDGLIDGIVFSVGLLDLFKVDFAKAWYAVLAANMNKTVGVKEGRSNPLGLPDLVKNADWVAPSHEGNTGLFERICNE